VTSSFQHRPNNTSPLTAADIKANGTSMAGNAGQNTINLSGIDPSRQRIFIVKVNHPPFSINGCAKTIIGH
jgi:hypothetical protein